MRSCHRASVSGRPGRAFTLADFAAYADWPTQVADHLTFEIDFDGGVPVAATRVPLSPAESDVDLDVATWTGLFPSTTPVTPWSLRSVGARPFYSYPADQIAEYLRESYQKHGAGPTRRPTTTSMTSSTTPATSSIRDLTSSGPSRRRTAKAAR